MGVAELAARNARRFKDMDERLNVSFDRFIRTTEPDASSFGPGGLEPDAAEWRHLYRHLCRLVFGARRGLLRRGGNRPRRGQCAPRPAGLAGRVGRGEELLLQAVRLSGPVAGALREPAGFHRSGFAPQRSHQLREGRAEGSVDLAHDVRLGRQGAERPRARDVCLGRCADQLHHRRRLSRRERCELALLAGGRAHHRQGHHPLPRGVLAGVPDVGRHSRAEAGLCARLPVQQGREDVEVGRQRRRSLQSRRPVWRRPDALFLPARGAVRAGRQLQPRSHRRAHQCRSRQRSRQSGAALAVDDRQATRRRAARARRVHRQRQGDPGGGRCHAGGIADGDGDPADPSMAERGVVRGRRSQPLFRGRGAVGAGQDRSGAAEDRACT